MCPPSIIDIAHIFPLLWFLPTSLPTSQRETGRERKEILFLSNRVRCIPPAPGEGVEVVAGVASASSKIPYVMERGKVIDGRLANNFWLVAPEQRAVPLRIIDGIKYRGTAHRCAQRPAHRYVTARPRRAARSPFPIAEWSPQKRKCVTQITDGRGAASYTDNNRTHTSEEGEQS